MYHSLFSPQFTAAGRAIPRLIRRRSCSVLAVFRRINIRRVNKQRVRVDELRWIGIGKIVTAAVINIRIVNNVLVSVHLLIRLVVVPGVGNVVDKVTILGVIGRNLSITAYT